MILALNTSFNSFFILSEIISFYEQSEKSNAPKILVTVYLQDLHGAVRWYLKETVNYFHESEVK